VVDEERMKPVRDFLRFGHCFEFPRVLRRCRLRHPVTKKLVPVIPKASLPEPVEIENLGDQLTQVQLEES